MNKTLLLVIAAAGGLYLLTRNKGGASNGSSLSNSQKVDFLDKKFTEEGLSIRNVLLTMEPGEIAILYDGMRNYGYENPMPESLRQQMYNILTKYGYEPS